MTGGTGFVGRRLLERLVEAGHDVTLVAHRATGVEQDGVKVVHADVRSRSSLRHAFDRAEVLFHLAAWTLLGHADADTAWAVNVQGTRNVLDAARLAKVGRVIHTSTAALDPQGRTVYLQTKHGAHLVAEQYARAGLDVVILMPCGVYGPGAQGPIAQLIDRAAAGRRTHVPGGLELSFAHVDDLAEVHMVAAEKARAGSAYLLAGVPTTVAQVMNVAADICGGRPTSVLPDRIGRLVPATLLREEARRGLPGPALDDQRSTRELGWAPRNIHEGLADTLRNG